MKGETMRRILIALMLGAVACSRGVKVETAPAAPAEVSLKVTNKADQAISVYVQASGSELSLGQVSPNSTELLSVRGVAPGSTVKLRATLADGSRSYTRDGVVLNGVFEWQVP
jgi:biopolymer transport protein ExbD